MSVSRSTLVVVGLAILLSLLAGLLISDVPITAYFRTYFQTRSTPVAQQSQDRQPSNKKDNLLWRNIASGQNAAWLLDGINYTGTIPLPHSEPNWMIVGEGDFDGDAKADILWRNNTNGQNVIWFI